VSKKSRVLVFQTEKSLLSCLGDVSRENRRSLLKKKARQIKGIKLGS